MAFGLYGAIGFQFVITVVLGFYAGFWLDKKFATQPWISVAGVVVGSALGFYSLVRLVAQVNKDENSD